MTDSLSCVTVRGRGLIFSVVHLPPLAIDSSLTFTVLVIVRDARPTQTYSFLPASWAGDTHEETDFLPIGDQEEKER